MSETTFILTLTSAPLLGIIAAVSTAIADLGGNIHETHQHWDRPTDRFFLRVAFLGSPGLDRRGGRASSRFHRRTFRPGSAGQ